MSESCIGDFDDLVRRAADLQPARIAVVWITHKEAFEAVGEARKTFGTEFHLVGDRQVIEDGLAAHGVSRDQVQIHHRPASDSALVESIRLAKDGAVDILMKGGIDTSQMMKAVLSEESGLRSGKLLSDILVFESPLRQTDKLILLTDGGITLAPDLREKVQIVENAVEVAQILGKRHPKVAILSAMEYVLPNLQSTIDAAALAKMNQRGQIKNCLIDGPLALDNAVSADSARAKGIESPVAGKADILVAPDIESANILGKSIAYFGRLRLAHVGVGARIPILIASRADNCDNRLLSIALGTVVQAAGKSQRRQVVVGG